MKKKFLSTLLAFCLCLSLLPTAVLAASDDAIAETTYSCRQADGSTVVQSEEIKAATLSGNNLSAEQMLRRHLDRAADSADGCTFTYAKITLTRDVTISLAWDDLLRISTPNLVLDLNGRTLAVAGGVILTSELTIIDSSAGQAGKFACAKFSAGDGATSGSLTLSGGTLDVTLDAPTYFSHSLSINGSSSARFVGGTVRGTVYVDYSAVPSASGASLTVEGGTFENEVTIFSTSATAKISGGRFTTLSSDLSAENITLSGGTFDCLYIFVPEFTPEYADTNFVPSLAVGSALYHTETGALIDASAPEKISSDNSFPMLVLRNVAVRAHDCSPGPDGSCACGRRNTTVSGSVEGAVAKVVLRSGSVVYPKDMTELWSCISSQDSSITLLRPLVDSVSNTFIYTTTLDLNGYAFQMSGFTISYATGALTITDSSAKKEGVFSTGWFTVNAGGSLTVESGTLDVLYRSGVKGSLTVSGGTVKCAEHLTVEGGHLTVSSGTLDAAESGISLYPASSAAAALLTLAEEQPVLGAQDVGNTMLVSGGTVKADIGVYSDTTLTVSGGTLKKSSSGRGICVYGGTASVSGGSLDSLAVCNSGAALLTGGAFGAVTIQPLSSEPTSVISLLGDGCAYYRGETIATPTEAENVSCITDVTVKPHRCAFVKGEGSEYACVCGRSFTAEQELVPYLGTDGSTKYCTQYTTLDSAYFADAAHRDSDGSYPLSRGWYVVRGNAALGDHSIVLEKNADVYLILTDNSTLTAAGIDSAQEQGGDPWDGSTNLTIYAQSTGANMGKLISSGYGRTYAGDPTNSYYSPGPYFRSYGIYINGKLTINGGDIQASGRSQTETELLSASSYGIYTSNALTINGGKITATGGDASITLPDSVSGSADAHSSGICVLGTLTINSGEVTATGGSTTLSCAQYATSDSTGIQLTGNMVINGGDIQANSGKASATGELAVAYSVGIASSNRGCVSISGRDTLVTATADEASATGTDSYATSCALYLNGDLSAAGGTLSATGGKATCTRTAASEASDEFAACSYGIQLPEMGNMNISGGNVTAASKEAVSIGSGTSAASAAVNAAYGDLTVSGGTLSVTGDIGVCLDHGNMTVSGGTFTATGSNSSSDIRLTYGNLAVSGGTIQLKESYINGYVSALSGKTLLDILADGYTYWTKASVTEGSCIDTSGRTQLTDGAVYVVKCPHQYTNDVCGWCGMAKPGTGGDPSGGGSGSSDTGWFPSSGSSSNSGSAGNGPSAPAMPFVDVPAGAYYYDAVLWAVKNGITGGVDESHFDPIGSCTRAQLVTFLWRAAGCPVVAFAMDFTDIDTNAYYSEAIRWAASLGIVDGYGNGLFGTGDTITREQMAVILHRFAQAMGMDAPQGGTAVRSFADYDSISIYAREAMQWAVSAGVLQGDNNTLMPGQPCTRAQIVTMLHRLLGK